MDINNLLYITHAALMNYKTLFRGNEHIRTIEARKKLTRNFILGYENKRIDNSLVFRKYGNMEILIDLDTFRVLRVAKAKKNRSYHLNTVEKRNLNKLFDIREV